MDHSPSRNNPKEFNSTLAFDHLETSARLLRSSFQSAVPFRYVIIDGFLRPAIAREAARSFPPYDRMERVRNSLVEKRASESRLELLSSIFNEIFADLRSPYALSLIESITEFEQLSAPNLLDGAGLHQVRDGGFHNVHADKNIDPVAGNFHRLSLIVYLNEEWRAGSVGALEFWDPQMQQCVTRIDPLFNRCVIFEVHDRAYHGYGRISLPQDITRKSLAMWYLSPVPGLQQSSTPRAVKFYLRPGDNFATRLRHHAREASLKLPPPVRDALTRLKNRLPLS